MDPIQLQQIVDRARAETASNALPNLTSTPNQTLDVPQVPDTNPVLDENIVSTQPETVLTEPDGVVGFPTDDEISAGNTITNPIPPSEQTYDGIGFPTDAEIDEGQRSQTFPLTRPGTESAEDSPAAGNRPGSRADIADKALAVQVTDLKTTLSGLTFQEMVDLSQTDDLSPHVRDYLLNGITAAWKRPDLENASIFQNISYGNPFETQATLDIAEIVRKVIPSADETNAILDEVDFQSASARNSSDFVINAANSALLGFGDEAAELLGAQGISDRIRLAEDQYAEVSPVGSFTSSALGYAIPGTGIAKGVMAGAGKLTGALGPRVTSALGLGSTGAIEGAAAAVGASREDLADRGDNAIMGATLGALGALGVGAGISTVGAVGRKASNLITGGNSFTHSLTRLERTLADSRKVAGADLNAARVSSTDQDIINTEMQKLISRSDAGSFAPEMHKTAADFTNFNHTDTIVTNAGYRNLLPSNIFINPQTGVVSVIRKGAKSDPELGGYAESDLVEIPLNADYFRGLREAIDKNIGGAGPATHNSFAKNATPSSIAVSEADSATLGPLLAVKDMFRSTTEPSALIKDARSFFKSTDRGPLEIEAFIKEMNANTPNMTPLQRFEVISAVFKGNSNRNKSFTLPLNVRNRLYSAGEDKSVVRNFEHILNEMSGETSFHLGVPVNDVVQGASARAVLGANSLIYKFALIKTISRIINRSIPNSNARARDVILKRVLSDFEAMDEKQLRDMMNKAITSQQVDGGIIGRQAQEMADIYIGLSSAAASARNEGID